MKDSRSRRRRSCWFTASGTTIRSSPCWTGLSAAGASATSRGSTTGCSPATFAVAFYSDLDHLVVPSRNARIDHPDLRARNVAVRGVGHLSMPNNGRIAFQIALALRELRPHQGIVVGAESRLGSTE